MRCSGFGTLAACGRCTVRTTDKYDVERLGMYQAVAIGQLLSNGAKYEREGGEKLRLKIQCNGVAEYEVLYSSLKGLPWNGMDTVLVSEHHEDSIPCTVQNCVNFVSLWMVHGDATNAEKTMFLHHLCGLNGATSADTAASLFQDLTHSMLCEEIPMR